MNEKSAEELFEYVLNDIVKCPWILKLTPYIFDEHIIYEKIIRVKSFYIENNKKFVWLKQWKNNMFIYGNPFSSYSF